MKKKKGFTLIEVVLAMAVLAAAVLPILSMYPSALKMSTRATELEEWSRLNQTIVDYIKSRGYTYWADNTNRGKLLEVGGSTGKKFSFTKVVSSSNYKSEDFEKALYNGTTPNLFLLNTKGLRLEDYELVVEMNYDFAKNTSGTSEESYLNLDTTNYMITTSAVNSNKFIHGVVKLRKNGDSFTDINKRDLNFIITPIDEWR